MKIVYLYPHFAHKAGTERILIEKMNYLSEVGGHEIIMLTYEQNNHPVAFPLSSKVRHVDLDVCFYPLYRQNRLIRFFKWRQRKRLLQERFNAFMAEEHPDIIVAVTYYAANLVLITSCPIRSIRILESHIDRRFILSNDPENRHSLLHWLHMEYDMRILIRHSRKFDLLVALNQRDAQDWSRYLKAVVIPNVVHLNPTGKVSSLENKRIIFVGRFMEQKGIFDLLKIWELVFKRHPDWQLDLYGEGDLREKIEQEAKRQNSNIRIHVPDEHIFDRYLESSILVLTSKYEPFGLVIPEAMNCGLPVVAFEGDGPNNIITNGEDGYIVRNRSLADFADCICKLIEDKELCSQMGQRAVVSSRRYASEHIMPQWESLFQELIK